MGEEPLCGSRGQGGRRAGGAAPAARGETRRQAVSPQPMEGSGGPQDGRRSLGKPALGQAGTEGRPAGRTHAREVCEELQPAGGTHAGGVRAGLSPVGGTPRWSRGGVRSPPPEEEGAAETRCEEPTPTHIPCSPAPLRGGGREFGSGVEPGRKDRWGEGVLRFAFTV